MHGVLVAGGVAAVGRQVAGRGVEGEGVAGGGEVETGPVAAAVLGNCCLREVSVISAVTPGTWWQSRWQRARL